MSRRYLLDTTIVFYPDICEFRDYPRQEKSIQLNQPASRCMELMIEKAPKLVPQKDFYEYVWGESASTVQLNTLYQNISLLRKSLKSFGNDYADMVLTVPRKGFKFNEKFSIKPLDDENDKPVAEATIVIEPEADSEGALTPSTAAVSEEIVELQQTPGPSEKKTRHHFNTILLIILCIVMVGVFLVNPDRSPSFGLEHYAYIDKVSECNIYSGNKELTVTENELNGAGVNCKNDSSVYVKHELFSSEKTLIACDKPFGKGNDPDCITYHLLEGK